MLIALIVTILLVILLGHGLRSPRGEQFIVRHPYNNPYSDASGAREDRS